MPVPSSLLDTDGKIPEHSMVFVENLDRKPVIFKWAKARYRVEPGQQIPVPYYAMIQRCGDPRSINVPGGDRRKAYRAQEFERLCVKYGIYENHHLWEHMVPKLNVTTLTGEKIVTVLDDPQGTLDDVDTQRMIQARGQERTIEVLTQQMAQMQAQIAALSSGAPAAAVGVEVPSAPPSPDLPIPNRADTAGGQVVEERPNPGPEMSTDFAPPADLLNLEDNDAGIPIDSI